MEELSQFVLAHSTELAPPHLFKESYTLELKPPTDYKEPHTSQLKSLKSFKDQTQFQTNMLKDDDKKGVNTETGCTSTETRCNSTETRCNSTETRCNSRTLRSRRSSSTSEPGTPAGYTSKNALRERTRVESLRRAYLELQSAIPSVPLNTKLSKLDVLVLATNYISHLSQLLQETDTECDNNNNNNNNNNICPSMLHSGKPQPCPRSLQGASVHRLNQKGLLHPVKKWPMRVRLYAGVDDPGILDLLQQPAHAHAPVQSPSSPRQCITPSHYPQTPIIIPQPPTSGTFTGQQHQSLSEDFSANTWHLDAHTPPHEKCYPEYCHFMGGAGDTPSPEGGLPLGDPWLEGWGPSEVTYNDPSSLMSPEVTSSSGGVSTWST